MKDLYLVHHGVQGQQWGKRNGPPYPLDAEGKAERVVKREARREGKKVDRLARKYERKIKKSVRKYPGEDKDTIKKRSLEYYYKKVRDQEIINEDQRKSGRPVVIRGPILDSNGDMMSPPVVVSAEQFYQMRAKALEIERKALDKIRHMKI